MDSLKLSSPQGGSECQALVYIDQGPQQVPAQGRTTGRVLRDHQTRGTGKSREGRDALSVLLGPVTGLPGGSIPRGFSELQLHQHPDLRVECSTHCIPKPRGGPGYGVGTDPQDLRLLAQLCLCMTF